MSWDPYIDNLVAQSKDATGTAHADKACIIGIDGGASWTSEGHGCALKLQGTEGADIARCFKSKDFSPFMSNGVKVEGTKYQFLREEDSKLVLCKKKGEGALTIQCSKTALVVAHCPEGGQQGSTNKGVGVIADYLESMNM
ncbi:profilin-like [Pecten maximus]|uniref:profilin-like n=1 Tax=Pecten maximus TaxID=6579 RepID=UPI001459111A|nr:profilin-like [Pecten maximus]